MDIYGLFFLIAQVVWAEPFSESILNLKFSGSQPVLIWNGLAGKGESDRADVVRKDNLY